MSVMSSNIVKKRIDHLSRIRKIVLNTYQA